MADFNNLTLTTNGLRALLAAQAGTTLTLTKIGMGSGSATSGVAGLTNLVSTEVMMPISEKKINEESGFMTIVAKMTNEDIEAGFYWRETGLFFEDSDGNDVLFAYACVVDNHYDYVPAYSDQRYVKHVRIANIITDSADITIKENAGLVYVDTLTFEEFKVDLEEYKEALNVDIEAFKQHIKSKGNVHGATASDIGALAQISFMKDTDDLNTPLTSGVHVGLYVTNANTLNTPYKQGLTTLTGAVVLSYGSSEQNAFQIAFPSGQPKGLVFTRSLTNGTIQKWSIPFLPLSGGTLGGPLGFMDGIGRIFADEDGLQFDAFDSTKDDKNKRFIKLTNTDSGSLIKNALKLYERVNGVNTEYRIFGEHNVPTAKQVGALAPSDVVDNLTSTATNLPLSAKQGNLIANAKKAMITACGTNKSLAVTDELKQIILNNTHCNSWGKGVDGKSYKFELTSDGAIICPHTGFLLVSGSVYLKGVSGSERTKKCFIKHAKHTEVDGVATYTMVEECFQSIRDMGATGGLSAGSKIIPVQDGDKLYLYAQSSVDTTCDTTHVATYLSAMYLD